MIEKRVINAFISSANRANDETIYDFTVNFPDDAIECGDGEMIKLNVVSFDMVNTMYNINETNNKFIIKTYTIHYKKELKKLRNLLILALSTLSRPVSEGSK